MAKGAPHGGTAKGLVFVAATVPLLRLAVLGLGEGLGANPLEFVTRSTGTWTLVFLLLTLAVTPVRRLTGWSGIQRYRRMLGLFAFFYGSLHLLTYLWWDQFFDWAAILHDVAKRPFIMAGLTAYGLMVPLALTSTQGMMRRLGRRWQLLHRLVYGVAVAGVVHYIWLVKKDLTQPLIYGVVLALLLGARAVHALRARGGRGK